MTLLPVFITDLMNHGRPEETGEQSFLRTSPSQVSSVATVCYMWKKWRLTPTAIALSDSYVVALTSTGYVRVYTLHGTPYRIHRQKHTPVTCVAWRDYVLTMGNGPVDYSGQAQLMYTIENVKRDEVCQSEDVVALPGGQRVRNVFFSDTGVCVLSTLALVLVLTM